MTRKSSSHLLFLGSIFAGLCLFLLAMNIAVPSSAHSATALLQQPTPLAIVHTGHGEMKVYDPQQLKQAIGVWRKTTILLYTHTATAPARRSDAPAWPERGVPVVPLLRALFLRSPVSCRTAFPDNGAEGCAGTTAYSVKRAAALRAARAPDHSVMTDHAAETIRPGHALARPLYQ